MNKSDIKSKCIVVLDIGTSWIKCGALDSCYNILCFNKIKFGAINISNSYEVDFENVYSNVVKVLSLTISEINISSFKFEALLITGQAQTFTPVNEFFQPLSKGIVWLDTRAKEEAKYLAGTLKDLSKKNGCCKPDASLYTAKLLWLKNKRREIFNKAKYFPTICEYIAYKLTGKYYSDYTNFGMTGMLNLNTKQLDSKILKILGLTNNNFPELAQAASISYPIINVQPAIGVRRLGYSIPLFMCGNDQSASSYGAGLKEEGDVTVNFGTAMVFYTLTPTLTTCLKNNQIAGIDPTGENYFLISYEDEFGNIIEELKNKYYSDNSYETLFSEFNKIGSDCDFLKYESVTAGLLNEDVEDIQLFTASIIKYFLDKFIYHLNEIEKLIKISNVYLSGGVMQSETWLKILQNACKYELKKNVLQDAGIIGAAKIYATARRSFQKSGVN